MYSCSHRPFSDLLLYTYHYPLATCLRLSPDSVTLIVRSLLFSYNLSLTTSLLQPLFYNLSRITSLLQHLSYNLSLTNLSYYHFSPLVQVARKIRTLFDGFKVVFVDKIRCKFFLGTDLDVTASAAESRRFVDHMNRKLLISSSSINGTTVRHQGEYCLIINYN